MYGSFYEIKFLLYIYGVGVSITKTWNNFKHLMDDLFTMIILHANVKFKNYYLPSQLDTVS